MYMYNGHLVKDDKFKNDELRYYNRFIDYCCEESPQMYTIYEKDNFFVDIERVVFNDPATIVIWEDGTKTVVKCNNEKYDKEKGLAMCIAKKWFGNTGKYFDVFKKFIKESEQ